MLNFLSKSFLFFLLIIFLIPLNNTVANENNNLKKVAITQIVSHESLNKVKNGVIKALEEKYFGNIKIDISNANGSIVTANQIATKLVSNNYDLIVAIATPSAQTIVKATNKIPILFASITDPVGAKLVNNLENPKSNISGVVNFPPIKEQLELIKNIIPNLNRIGIILNKSEANSSFMLNKIKEEAGKVSIQVLNKSITNTNEVSEAAFSLVDKVDAFLVIQDNMVASNFPGILRVANKFKKPIFGFYLESVEKGALMALAFDEYEIGIQTGKMAIEILEGESIYNMPVQFPKDPNLYINSKIANYLNIKIPNLIIKRSSKIY